jgi:hypothetical protein
MQLFEGQKPAIPLVDPTTFKKAQAERGKQEDCCDRYRAIMNTGGYIALGLVIIEVMLTIIFFVRGKPSKGAFIAASGPMFFLGCFFWLGNRITEATFTGIGTIRAAATTATQYVEDIKNIKTDVDRQKQAVDAVAASAHATEQIINQLTEKNDRAAKQLQQVEDQLAQAKTLTQELQQKQEYWQQYWEVAHLTALGLSGYVAPGQTFLVEHSPINDLLRPHVKLQPELWVDCVPEALTAYASVIKMNDKFPFAYYYRAMCNRAKHIEGWQRDFQKAKSILEITTTIPGHNHSQDEVLKLIETDNLNASMPPGSEVNRAAPN